MNGSKIESRRRADQVGVQGIADALGISRGTVDRALHNRGGVNPRTKRRVLRAAQRLGYRPNLAARYLSSRKRLTIGIALPLEVAFFYDDIREGIFEAASVYEPLGVKVLHRTYKRFGEHEIEAVRDVLQKDIRGLVISPAYPNRLRPYIDEASSRNIPVVCVATDAPETKRLTTVSVDPLVCGALAGELMGYFLHAGGNVVVFIGMHATVDHEQKLRGFRSSLRAFCPEGKIAAVVETHDEALEAYQKCWGILEQQQPVAGIYVSTANSMPVLRALEELGLTGKVKVICTDLFPALLSHIRSGAVAATIHQRPLEQGREAFRTLVRYLTEGISPEAGISLNPAVVMRSNLELFTVNGISRSALGSQDGWGPSRQL